MLEGQRKVGKWRMSDIKRRRWWWQPWGRQLTHGDQANILWLHGEESHQSVCSLRPQICRTSSLRRTIDAVIPAWAVKRFSCSSDGASDLVEVEGLTKRLHLINHWLAAANYDGTISGRQVNLLLFLGPQNPKSIPYWPESRLMEFPPSTSPA